MSLKGRPVNKTVEKRYLAQRRRGTDGFGFFTPSDNTLTHNPREGRTLALLRRRKATEILFHHRMPTSTINVRNACHPFSTKDYFEHNYVIVHNGVLWNEAELKKNHEFRGIQYVSEQADGSFNDSEALAYDIAQYLEGEVDKITAEGSIAFIAIQMKDGKRKALYFGRNTGNPLMMKKTRKSLTLSSEGDGVLIDPHVMHRYDYETGVLSKHSCMFPSWTSYSAQSGYSRYTDSDYYPSDDEFSDINHSGYFRNTDAGREAEKARVNREIIQLMRSGDFDIQKAIYSGYEQLEDLEADEYVGKQLASRLELSHDDALELNAIVDNIYYLKQAIQSLERRLTGGTQQPFPLDHTLQLPAPRESIDPHTGKAYYEFAD